MARGLKGSSLQQKIALKGSTGKVERCYCTKELRGENIREWARTGKRKGIDKVRQKPLCARGLITELFKLAQRNARTVLSI